MNSPFDAHINRERVSLEDSERLSKTPVEKSSALQANRPADETENLSKQAANDFVVPNLESSWTPASSDATTTADAFVESPACDQLEKQAKQQSYEHDDKSAHLECQIQQPNKMLVVDDLPVNRKLISIQLRKMGFEVDSADNGQDAVNKVKSATYSLVFMDLEMPVMDGYQAAIQIRQYDLETRQHTPIIALSSYYRQTERERCISSGMDELISKGVGGRQLQEIVQRYMRRPEDLPTTYKSKLPENVPGIEIDFQLLCETHGRLDEEIVDLSLGSIKTFIGCLKCALEDRDLLSIKHFAQALTGPCAVLGLKSMNKLAIRILSNVAKSNWPAAAQGMALLESQYSQILDQLTGLSATLHRVDEKLNGEQKP